MVEFKVLTSKNEKAKYKHDIQKLFEFIFGKVLSDVDWMRFLIEVPYEDSYLVVGIHGNTVVATANLLPQRMRIADKEISYLLFTTSMIHQDYRRGGLYFEKINILKNILNKSIYDLIFVFPNNNAYPVLTKFSGFNKLKEFNLLKVKSADIDKILNIDIKKTCLLDPSYVRWRFRNEKYFVIREYDKALICKEYDNKLDVLEILTLEDYKSARINLLEKDKSIKEYEYCYISDKNCLAKTSNIETVIRPIYYAKNKVDISNLINVNLLMWDVL